MTFNILWAEKLAFVALCKIYCVVFYKITVQINSHCPEISETRKELKIFGYNRPIHLRYSASAPSFYYIDWLTFDYRDLFFCLFVFFFHLLSLGHCNYCFKQVAWKFRFEEKTCPRIFWWKKATPYPRTSLKLTVLEQYRMRRKIPLKLSLLSSSSSSKTSEQINSFKGSFKLTKQASKSWRKLFETFVTCLESFGRDISSVVKR